MLTKHFKGHKMQYCADQIDALISNELPKDFISKYRERSFEAFKANIKPVEGVTDLIKNLNIPYCVASSGPENKIKLNLELTGLLSYFEHHIFSCYTIQKWKPSPEVFLWAAKTMGFKPSECVVIEDSITGVRAAKNGGFDVIGYTAHDYNNELQSEATFSFNAMLEIKEFFRRS